MSRVEKWSQTRGSEVVGAQAGGRARCLFPCISSLDGCLLDDGIKESFNMTSALVFFSLLFDRGKHLVLPLKLGHTVHNVQLVERRPNSPALFRYGRL